MASCGLFLLLLRGEGWIAQGRLCLTSRESRDAVFLSQRVTPVEDIPPDHELGDGFKPTLQNRTLGAGERTIQQEGHMFKPHTPGGGGMRQKQGRTNDKPIS